MPAISAAAVAALGATLRVRASGVEPLRPLWRARRPLIYAVWHGRILIVPWLNARLREREGARCVRVLASRSRDGELVAAFVRRFGLDVVRGSSSRGGAAALRALARAVRAGEDVAVVPDGPRGPACRLQAGIIALAAATGAPIVPLGVAARPARRLASWDRFMVPAPFARCAVVFGAALDVGRDADRETQRARVERALQDVTDAADRLVRA
ncbi:MAG TPA: lysophospholipid acyltransferase family protein [Methylomirabilota bacterium]|nr:lysophospholipid acyltransferase family protein [Methylomirabilota bacterium]